MLMRGLLIVSAFLLLTAAGMAQMAGGYTGYLDVSVFRVKPEKRTDFDAVTRRFVDANRKNKGDTWLASEVIYGEGSVVYFISGRDNFGAAEKAMDAFASAVSKAVGGPAAMDKLFQDAGNDILGSRTDFRRRRGDLSANPPADAAAYATMVGESRWARITTVRVKIGRGGEFEELAKTVKRAREGDMPKISTLVSQSMAGQPGAVYYLVNLGKSLSDFDSMGTPLPRLLGEEGFQKYLKGVEDTILNTDTVILRFLPELSNPPEEVANASPAFWRPKPPAPAKPRAKPAEAPRTQ